MSRMSAKCWKYNGEQSRRCYFPHGVHRLGKVRQNAGARIEGLLCPGPVPLASQASSH